MFAKIRLAFIMFIVFIFVGVMIPFVAIFRKSNNIFRFWTSKLILMFSGINLKIVGTPDENTQLFIMNHKSMLDIMVLEVASGKKHDLSWVAKKELFKIPYFGLALSLTKMINLNREDRQGIIKLLNDVKDRVLKKRTVAIFPEGTRYPKDKFLPFKSGAGIVANKLKLKVQPVVLINTAKIFDVKNLFSSSKDIEVIFLDSFEATKDRDWLQDSRTKMLEIFLEKLER